MIFPGAGNSLAAMLPPQALRLHPGPGNQDLANHAAWQKKKKKTNKQNPGQIIKTKTNENKQKNKQQIKTKDNKTNNKRETHFRSKDKNRLKVKGWQNLFPINGNQKRSEVSILISTK